jgi:hypothetical protein
MGAISRVMEFLHRPRERRELDQRAAMRELGAHGFQPMPMQPNVFVKDRPDGRIKVHFFEAGGMAQHDSAGKLKIEIGTLGEILAFVRPLLSAGRRAKSG